MNIFVLDRDPVKAARMLCDAHVVKMIVESCQLLSTHDRIVNRWDDDSLLYKPTHQNHPCRVCLYNEANRRWLERHLNALIFEYWVRFGKRHKCTDLLHKYWYVADCTHCTHDHMRGTDSHRRAVENICGKQSLPKCMPDEFKIGGEDMDSVVRSYRQYYKQKQQTMKRFRYTKREMPEWLKEE